MKKKFFYSLTIFLFSLYLIRLHIDGKWDFYVHPRFEVFSLIFTILAFIISFVATAFYSYKLFKKIRAKKDRFKFELNTFLTTSLFVVILGVCFIVPPKVLSSRQFDNSIDNLNNLNRNANDQELTTLQRFSTDTSSFDLGDWIISLNTDPDLDNYVDKNVDITGFVFKAENLERDLFYVSRFAITCCVVDATPVGLLVDSSEKNELEDDQWIRIKGKFAIEELNGVESLVIIPESIEKIEQPDKPYVY